MFYCFLGKIGIVFVALLSVYFQRDLRINIKTIEGWVLFDSLNFLMLQFDSGGVPLVLSFVSCKNKFYFYQYEEKSDVRLP